MEKDTETYEVVQEAIETMQRVAWHINDMKRKHEHAVRLQVRKARKKGETQMQSFAKTCQQSLNSSLLSTKKNLFCMTSKSLSLQCLKQTQSFRLPRSRFILLVCRMIM